MFACHEYGSLYSTGIENEKFAYRLENLEVFPNSELRQTCLFEFGESRAVIQQNFHINGNVSFGVLGGHPCVIRTQLAVEMKICENVQANKLLNK